MKKLYLILLILLSSTISLMATEFAGGTGTESDPFRVALPEHLNNVRNYTDKWFRQTENIDLSGYGNWVPIVGNGDDERFTGHYDGGGNTISNLTIDRTDEPNVGLFGHVGMNGDGYTTLKNIKLVNVQVTGGRGTGALAGRVTGNQNTRIEYCSVDGGVVQGNAAVGGLVGSNNSSRLNNANAESFRPVIYTCWANVDVSMTPNTDPSKIKYGGLTGCNQKGLISNSYALGNVTAGEGADRIGGLAGCVEFRGIVINSFAMGTVSGPGSRIGGLLGFGGEDQYSGTVISSYFLSDPNNGEGVPLTDAQMKIQSSFEDWDFINIWIMETDSNYPTLRENPPASTNIWTWTGTTDQDWNKATNWEGEGTDVPPKDGQAVVVIPAGDKNWPVINENIVLQDLLMGTGAKFTLVGVSLSVSGKLEFDGGSEQLAEIITTYNGQLILAGQNRQQIPAMIFQNLTIKNPNNVSLAGDITVMGTLKMNTGFLDLNGFDITLLGEDATLAENEDSSTSSRVFGASGIIKRVQTIVSGVNPDIAGIGLGIKSNLEMVVTIERGHSELAGSEEATSIMRWFNITPNGTPEGLNATVTFHYFLGELQEVDTNPALSLFKRMKEGEVWQPWEYVYSNAENKSLVADNVTSFSQWTASDASIPMPIVLLSFDGKALENTVELHWTTAAELNNDYFTIERSRNGVSFKRIGTISGAGTTSQMHHYSFTDIDPITGVAYYRLKQTDFNGDFEYSKIISVYTRTVLSDEIRLFPNPSNGQFKVITNGEKAMDLRIYNMLGKMVYSRHAAPGHVTSVDISGLQKGIYTVIFYGDEIIARKIQVY